MNVVVLIGRLVAEPEYKVLEGSGKQVANFRIAVNKEFKSDSGSDADFFDVSAWGQSAEFVTNYCLKGHRVAVNGRIQQRTYSDSQTGAKRTAYDIIANRVELLEAKGTGSESSGDRGSQGGRGNTTPPPQEPEQPDPFAEE